MLGTLLSSVGRVVLAKGSGDNEASQFDVLMSREELRVGDILLPVAIESLSLNSCLSFPSLIWGRDLC